MNFIDEDKSIIVRINRKTLIAIMKSIVAIIVLYLAFTILPYTRQVFTPFILSVLLTFLLNPLVKFFERNGLNRLAAVLTIMILLSLVIATLVILLSPIVSREIQSIASGLENKTPTEVFDRLMVLLKREIPLMKNPEISREIMEKTTAIVYELLNQSINIIPNIFSGVITLVLIPFMTFFLLKDGRRIKKSLIQMVPNRYFEMALSLTHKIDRQLGSYIRGQLLVSIVIGTLSVIALSILNVPYYFFIGVLAGAANMIPYFGPIAGAVPAVILNFVDKGTFNAAIMVVIAFAVIRLIDDTVVSPNILGRSVEIHPLVVIIVIFIGSEMFGLLGLLLCIPVTGIIKVTAQELIWGFKNYRLI
ncbi:AI-2E family transporter [candidate division KSB1 bacterium]|nr:AI-2E family transporter [candidate division KSB1 bacterium]